MTEDPREVFPGHRFPWPFPGGRFPDQLGAVVMRTVADGTAPALIVQHWDDLDWSLADGTGDPNEPGASIVSHMVHLVDLDPTLAELITMPPGKVAIRQSAQHPWSISDDDG